MKLTQLLLAASLPVACFADTPAAQPAAANVSDATTAASMKAEMMELFAPIPAKYQYPDAIFLVVSKRKDANAADSKESLQIFAGAEAIKFLSKEREKLAADVAALAKRRIREADEHDVLLQKDIAERSRVADRKIRALNNAVEDRRAQLDAEERDRLAKLKELDALIATRQETLKQVTLRLSVANNDLTTAQRDSVALAAEVSAERARLVEARRERAFVADETMKRAGQLDQANQILGTSSR